jgi:hypothetical protein
MTAAQLELLPSIAASEAPDQRLIEAVIDYGVLRQSRPLDWVEDGETPSDQALVVVLKLIREVQETAFQRGYLCGQGQTP